MSKSSQKGFRSITNDKKISTYELQNTPITALKAQYKVNDQELRCIVREKVWEGDRATKENFYSSVYSNKV